MQASNYNVRRLRNRGGKESGTDSGRRMDFEGGTRIGDHLGSPRVAPLFFDGHPKNLMLLFTLWLMHDCATRPSHASLAALHAPFGPHKFRDNPSERPRLREVARWVKENEKSGTDYEPVFEEASY